MTPTIEQAKDAYRKREFVRAGKLLDFVIHEAPNRSDVFAARYLRARGFEDGLFGGGVDLERALEDFRFLNEQGFYGGALGCARVLLARDAAGNARAAIALCQRALRLKPSAHKARIIMGFAFEHGLHDYARAKHCYLAAYRKGFPWGLLYYARLQKREGHRFAAMAAAVLFMATRPLLEGMFGKRTPFR